MVFSKGGCTFGRSSVNDKVLIARVRGGSDGRAIAFCFLDKTNATDPRSVLIDLEAIVPSLPYSECCLVARTPSLSLNILIGY